MSNPAEIKQSLRKSCLSARRAIELGDMVVAGDSITKYLVGAIGASPKIVAGYIAMRSELDIAPALHQLSIMGHTLCLPVVDGPGKPLIFRRWPWGERFVKDMHGVRVPSTSQPVLVPDVVIVPMLAFDAAGYRLGYGAGYYDLTIEDLRKKKSDVEFLGAAYSQQQMEAIPVEAHDQKLDAIITEKGAMRFT